jgi:hypothetical protein
MLNEFREIKKREVLNLASCFYLLNGLMKYRANYF